MRPIDAVQVLKDINRHHKPTPVSEFESGFNQGLNQAMWIITHAPTLTPPNEWASVEERLPAPTENLVLVYDCTGVNMAWYSYAMGWKYRTGLPGVEITHWMPLPEPPKEETP